MAEETHKQTQRTPTPSQQQLLLRALVGSLVFYAVLAPSSARAQAISFDKQRTSQQTTGREKRRQQISSRRLRELLADVKKLTTPADFAPGRVIEISIAADAVGNPDDDPLHYFTIKSSSTTDPFWVDVFTRLGSDLRGSSFHHLIRDASHFDFTLKLDELSAVATFAADFDSAARAAGAADAHKLAISRALGNFRGTNAVTLLNSLNVSASGKQFAAKLEMSREQLGNLLRQSLSLP